jgi:hypothetical protein
MRIGYLLALVLAVCLPAQETLNNETILKLAKAGVGEGLLVSMINQRPGQYALSADEIVRLKSAGVPDGVIAAMIVRTTATDARLVAGKTTSVGISSEPNVQAQAPRDAVGGPPRSGPIRVYVTDSQSWEIRGGWSSVGRWNAMGGGWAGSGYQAGGARPQTAEIIKTFNQRCPEITVTNRVDNADFAVTLDHEGGKGLLRRRNKMVIFDRNGDDIFSDSTRELGSSVKDGCDAILRNSTGRGSNAAAADNGDALVSVTFASTPPNALVTFYGAPVGRTPFTIKLAPGAYEATFSASGYSDLTQQFKVAAGYPATLTSSLKVVGTQ